MVVVAAHGNASRIAGQECDPLPVTYVLHTRSRFRIFGNYPSKARMTRKP